MIYIIPDGKNVKLQKMLDLEYFYVQLQETTMWYNLQILI